MSDNGALTLERLQAMIANLPPPPPPATFCSCRLFPRERAVGFRDENGDEYHIAHPDFWKAAIRVEYVPDFKCTPFGLWGVPLIDLDASPDEYRRITGIMLASMERQMRGLQFQADKDGSICGVLRDVTEAATA